MGILPQPSIFELFAQQQLKSGIREGAKYLSKVLVEQIPSIPQSLFYKFDEYYLLLDLLVEYSHLKVYNCSFSELFYRLKRINENGLQLTNRQILVSLMFLSVLPYLRQKLLNSYLIEKEVQYRTITDHRSFKQKLHHLNYKLYPKLFTCIDLINFINRLTYATGLSKKHSIDLHTCQSILTYQNPDDLERSTFSQILLNLFGLGINSGAFFMQFLDHWFIEQKSTSFFQMPFVKCPERINPSNDNTLCSICTKPKVNPTVISVSGYVFCFDCVHDYVKVFKRCPITYYPVSIDNLIKLN